MTNIGISGWRWIFWIQVLLHGFTFLGLLLFYWPPEGTVEFPKMSVREYFWACDPIGSTLFMSSATLMLLALNWVGGTYSWSDAHVVAPLTLGLLLLVALGLYEWKGRNDGLIAHVFFRRNFNFALSIFAFAVEGWVFYSAVNTITPALVLQMGFEPNSWRIAMRQLAFTFPSLFLCIPLLWYATRYKDLKTPLLVTFTIFLAVLVFPPSLVGMCNADRLYLTVALPMPAFNHLGAMRTTPSTSCAASGRLDRWHCSRRASSSHLLMPTCPQQPDSGTRHVPLAARLAPPS